MADETASIEILLQDAQRIIGDLGRIEKAIEGVRKAAQGLNLPATPEGAQQLNRLGNEAEEAGRKAKALREEGTALTRTFKNLQGAISAVALGALVRQFTRFIGRAIEVKRVFDGIEQTLKSVTETTDDYNRAQALVLDTARRLGLSVQGLGQDYANFLASTKPLALSQREIEDAFVAVSEAGRVLNLSQQRLNLTFLALSQIASKGIATMEELRRQLGDQLPGVFPRVAAALGVTTSELIEMIRAGEVLAEDVIPAITTAARDLAGGQVLESTKNLAASVARLKLEYELFLKTLAEGGEEGFKRAAERARTLISANDDLATSLGELAGALAESTVEAGGFIGTQVSNLKRLVEGLGELIEFLTFGIVPADFLTPVFAAFAELGTFLTDLLVGAPAVKVAFEETWASVADGAALSGKSIQQLAEEAGRTGEAAARAAGKVEESGQRVAQSVQESIRLIAAAREEAANEMAEAGNDALLDFEISISELVEAAKEAFDEQTDARREAVAEQIEIERAATQMLIAQFEERSRGFEVEESKRVDLAEKVAIQLEDVERKTAEKRQEILAEALAEGEKASADEREEILESAQEDLLELEEKLAKKREDIVRKGIERLIKLERDRAEEVKKQLDKIAKEAQKLADKRRELLKESREELREFSKELEEGLSVGDVEAGGGGAGDTLAELIRQRDELQRGFSVGSPEELAEFNRELEELNRKIFLAKSGVGDFGQTVGQTTSQAAFDFKEFSEKSVSGLLDIIGGDAFRTAFGQLSAAEQGFARTAIEDFLQVGQNAVLTEADVRRLLSTFETFGLHGTQGVDAVKDALDRLGEPSEVDQKLGELATKAQELGAAADVAVPPLQKIDTAVKGIAQSGEPAGAALDTVGSSLAANQETLVTAGTSIDTIAVALPIVQENATLLAAALPAILDRLAQAVENETLTKIGADIVAIVEAAKKSAEGMTALREGLDAILAAAEQNDKVKELVATLQELASEDNVRRMGELATSIKTMADELFAAGDAFELLGSEGGAVSQFLKLLQDLHDFVATRLIPKLGELVEAIRSVGEALREQQSDIATWEESWEGAISFIRQLIAELRADVTSLSEDLRNAAEEARRLGDEVNRQVG